MDAGDQQGHHDAADALRQGYVDAEQDRAEQQRPRRHDRVEHPQHDHGQGDVLVQYLGCAADADAGVRAPVRGPGLNGVVGGRGHAAVPVIGARSGSWCRSGRSSQAPVGVGAVS
jgi:hypothetical protein